MTLPIPFSAGTVKSDSQIQAARARLRERLDAVRHRAERATAWKSVTYYVGRLANKNGYTPVTARLSPDDLAFLTHARDDVLTFAHLGLRLLELHEPRDAGAVSSTQRLVLRCRTCMWRWPCPTYKALREALPDDPLGNSHDASTRP